jgi:Terminase large subunit, T4likevirus-type, N-terminal
LYQPRSLDFDLSPYRLLTASITQEQANIIFKRAVRMARQSPLIEPLIEVITRTPYPRMEFSNGSTIEARSTQNRGEYLLGQDYDLVIFDEVAFETDPEYVVEEVIQMRLADRAGRLDLVSTPNGKGWFYLRVQGIVTGVRKEYLLTGDSRDNQFISQEFLQERLTYFTPARVQQNIMGQFVDSGGEILPGGYVDRALASDLVVPSHSDTLRYITGWDLARKRTATVGVTVAVQDRLARVVGVHRFRQMDWAIVIAAIRATQEEYPGQLVVDATGLGDVVVEQIADLHPLSIIFTPSIKAELLTNLELFHARGAIGYSRWEQPDGPGRRWSLEDELRNARWDDNGRCDGVMALSLALWPLRKRSVRQPLPRVGAI